MFQKKSFTFFILVSYHLLKVNGILIMNINLKENTLIKYYFYFIVIICCIFLNVGFVMYCQGYLPTIGLYIIVESAILYESYYVLFISYLY